MKIISTTSRDGNDGLIMRWVYLKRKVEINVNLNSTCSQTVNYECGFLFFFLEVITSSAVDALK